MKDKLVEIHSLLELLGFTDIRSVKKFCLQNKIPLFNLGKKVYTIATFLDVYIEAELTVFVNENYTDPAQVMAAVKENDKTALLKLIESPQKQTIEKTKIKTNKSEMSKASKNLLNKLKSA